MGNNGQHRGRKADAELTRHGICRTEGIRANASFKKLDPSVSPELTSAATIKQWRTQNKMCSTGALHQEADALQEATEYRQRWGTQKTAAQREQNAV